MTEDVLDGIVGTRTSHVVVTVERGHVATFASAIKDDSPVYRDPHAASAAGLAGIPAPPTYPFVMEHNGAYPELQPQDAPTGSAVVTALAPLVAGGGLILHGEQEFEYHRPVFAGDVLEGIGTVTDAYRKEARGNTMTFVVVETVWTDHASGEPVCTSRMNVIHRA